MNPIGKTVNKFFLGGMWSPGVMAQPKGAEVVRKLDERQGYGIDFAFVIFFGRQLATFTCELLLVTRQDFIDYQDFHARRLAPVPLRGAAGTTAAGGYNPAKSWAIWHPQLTQIGITQCVVESEPQIELDDYMVGHVPIKFHQTKAKPAPGFARPETPDAAPPLSPEEQEIKRLSDVLASKRQVNQAAGR